MRCVVMFGLDWTRKSSYRWDSRYGQSYY